MAKELKPMRFETYSDPVTGKRGQVRIKAINRTFRGVIMESDPAVVHHLMQCPNLKFNPADAVACGIFTIDQVRNLGFLDRDKDVEELKKRLGMEPDAPTDERAPEAEVLQEKADAAPPPLPDHKTMYRDQVFNFWNSEDDDAKAKRGTDIIPFSPKLSKDRMLDKIKKELTKRGDPRADDV